MPQLRPISDRVLLKRDPPKRMSIIIDVPKDEESDSGTVLACGERCTQGLQTGDNVTFGKWSGHSVNMDGEDLLIVREEDIFFEGVAE